MIGIRHKLLGAAAACGFALAVAGQASAALNAYIPPNYTFPDGSHGFALATHSSDDFNPGVLVGFNPQPDPPGDQTLLDLHNHGDPLFNNTTDGGTFNFLIALLDVGDGSVIPGNPIAPPNSDGFTHFHGEDAGHTIDILFHFGGGDVGSWSWGAFNPQPDPPGDFIGGSFGVPADPFMSFELFIDGTPRTFTLGVPEAGTWALMILGLMGSGLMLRRARQLKLAAID